MLFHFFRTKVSTGLNPLRETKSIKWFNQRKNTAHVNYINTLEEKRKDKAAKFHALKVKKIDARKKAMNDKSVSAFNAELKKYGF